MTEEEAKKLTEGDHVLIAAPVSEVRQLAHSVIVRILAPDNKAYAFSPEALHGVLPRPLAVGDRVKLKTGMSSGKLLAIHEDTAWVQWVGACDVKDYWSVPLAGLERAS